MSLKDYRFDGSRKFIMKDQPTGAENAPGKKTELVQKTHENLVQAAALQEKLYAAGREALVIAIQARDAAGKDSLIKKVFSGLNPAALEVHAFKAPDKAELKHDYLWRLHKVLPERGKIGVFNRSQYEDVLAVRVHQLQKSFAMPERITQDADFFPKRYRQIRHWEQYLYENGVFLHVSQDEQRRRFLDRLELPEKHWKLSINDMKERALWDAYDVAYEDAINFTAAGEAPWYVLPADKKWYTRYLMSEILLTTLRDMAPDYPPLDPAEAARIPQVMEELQGE